jgi:hypothetical protein
MAVVMGLVNKVRNNRTAADYARWELMAIQIAAGDDRLAAECMGKSRDGVPYVVPSWAGQNRVPSNGPKNDMTDFLQFIPPLYSWADEAAWRSRGAESSRAQARNYARLKQHYQRRW